MAAKLVLVLCAQAILLKGAFSQCLAGLGGLASPFGLAGPAGYNGLAGAGLAGPGLAGAGLAGAGLAGAGLAGYGAGCGGVASTGGGLPVTSASPIAPVGVSVLSENAYEGTLAAGGNLPFLGTVGIEGVLPTAGDGAVSYGCGNGAAEIGTEGPIATGILAPENFAPANAIAAGPAGLGYNGFGYNGLGYNGLNGVGYNGLAGYGLAGTGCGSAAAI